MRVNSVALALAFVVVLVGGGLYVQRFQVAGSAVLFVGAGLLLVVGGILLPPSEERDVR